MIRTHVHPFQKVCMLLLIMHFKYSSGACCAIKNGLTVLLRGTGLDICWSSFPICGDGSSDELFCDNIYMYVSYVM